MGLDITWYRGVTPQPDAKVDEDGYPVDWENQTKLCRNTDFPGRCDDLDEVIYSFVEKGGFGCGAYSTYNGWREQLAELAGYPATPGEGPRHQHSNGAWNSTEGPFFELIHFTDCDGVIGTEISSKLARDFAEFQDKADALGAAGETFFHSQYSLWRNAFTQAAMGGFVEFH